MAKDIEIKVKLDTAGAQQQLQNAVNELEQNPIDIPINIPVEGSIAQLKALKRELRNTAAGSEEFKKLFNQIDDLEEKLGAANKASSDWIDTLAGAGGSLGALGQGLNKGKEAFSSFNNILKTSIIGIIVTAVTLLYQAFNKNKEAQDKLKPVLTAFDKILGGIFRAAEPLLDIFISLAEKALPIMASAISNVAAFVGGLVKGFGALGTAISELFQGNFSKAIDAAKGSGKAFSDGFTETKNKFIAGSKELTDAEKEELEKRKAEQEKAAEKRKALLEKQAAEAKRIREKEAAEAKKAAEELQKFEDQRIANNEKARVDGINAIDAANEIIRQKQIGQQQFEIDKIKEKYFTQLELQAGNDEAVKTLTEAQAIEIQAINDKYTKEAQDKKDKVKEQEKKDNDQKIADEKTVADAKRAINLSYLDGASQLIGIAKSLGEKNKGIQKAALIAESAIGIAKIVINTQAANAAAVAKYSAIPGGVALSAAEIVANKISAGIGIAANIAATGVALGKLGGGGAGDATAGNASLGGGATGGGATTALAPQVNLISSGNRNANSNVPQIPNINNNVVVKAVVSETEVTNTQQFVKKVEESAKI